MFMTATVNEALHDAKDYGFDIVKKNEFDWAMLKEKRDAYVKRLNGIYTSNLGKDNITYIQVNHLLLWLLNLDTYFSDRPRSTFPPSSHVRYIRAQHGALSTITLPVYVQWHVINKTSMPVISIEI